MTTAPTPLPVDELLRLHDETTRLHREHEAARARRDGAARFLAEGVAAAPGEPADPARVAEYVTAREVVPPAYDAWRAAVEATSAARAAWEATQGRGRREVDA